ncbi:polysaccharide deacetylase family protein [Bacillus sp. 03113]|uniref:polysaccharide deacetylase family protein n=1 Tax=Bacillus sp. 03113 TaxID=2578211 RepID=UPI00215BF900|nr:polysaccharide deacetylase family protein [Bacillus sp. 03113]
MIILKLIGFVILFFLFYSVIPTVLIRSFEIGITKRLKEENTIALTFDDGPEPPYTIEILNILKKYQVKATFFVVGEKVIRNPEIIKRMHLEGHTIGIHHFNHVSSWFLSPFGLQKQLEQTKKAISECINENVIYYRPPWGHFNLFTLLISRKYQVVTWSDILGDWKTSVSKNLLLDKLRLTKKDGSIIVLHDSGETFGADHDAPKYMIKNLEKYIQECQQKGIQFVALHDYEIYKNGRRNLPSHNKAK